jgi:uncharacterized protein YkwD
MPIKKHRTHHRVHPEKHKRSKKFLRVYAPYIPLLAVIGLSIFFGGSHEFKKQKDADVLAYATSVSRQDLLQSTNQHRAGNGQGDLTLNNKLSQAAQSKARDMSNKDYWSHTSPTGQQPWYFIEKSGYHYAKAAENLAYGFDTSVSTVSGWMNSPLHRKNMLDSKLSEVGFGIANSSDYQGSGPQTLVVAMYARPADEPAAAQSQGDFNAVQPAVQTAEKQSKITYIQSLTGGQAPWSNFLAGLVLGAGIMYLVFKHLRGIRKTLLSGEKFIIKHPLLDATVVAIVVLAVILTRTSGVIH